MKDGESKVSSLTPHFSIFLERCLPSPETSSAQIFLMDGILRESKCTQINKKVKIRSFTFLLLAHNSYMYWLDFQMSHPRYYCICMATYIYIFIQMGSAYIWFCILLSNFLICLLFFSILYCFIFSFSNNYSSSNRVWPMVSSRTALGDGSNVG